MDPRYPVYILSKGRWESRLTHKALTTMGVPHFMVVEEQERAQYAAVVSDHATLLTLDPRYQEEYDTCSDGPQYPTGSGPARNFIWDHAQASGAGRHWVMDDNIRRWLRYQDNRQIAVGDGTCFRVMEDFCDRYENVAMAGPHYFMFVPRKKGHSYPPVLFNSRIYSCNLILNSTPFRWRARYNEDVDLSLRMLKAGWCTVLFHAFLQHKTTTQRMKGGNTDTIYVDGTQAKSEMIARLHPDVARVGERYGRTHHYVDYRRFKRNVLRRREGIEVPKAADNYGMRLRKVEEA